MTELLTRPTTATSSEVADGRTPSLWWRGALAALWAVALGCALLVVLTLIVWATDSRSGAGAGQAIRVALQLWLAAQKVPLHVHPGTLAVAPLGLTVGLAFLVARASAVLARAHEAHTARDVSTIAVAVGVPYALLTTFVAAAANTSAARPSPLGALLAGAILGHGAAAWGAARGTGRRAVVLDAVPPWLARSMKAGAAALAVVIAAAMILTLGSLAAHATTAADMADALGGGVIAKFALLVLDGLLLPNAAFTVVGYLSGPGFALGAGTSVSVGGAHVGAVPALPLVAAVPHGAAPTTVRILVIAVLLAAAALAGWLVARDDGGTPARAAGGGMAAGAVAGALAALFAALAGGPAGGGRMAVVGASPWQVGLVLAAEVGCVAAAAAGLLTWRRRD